MEPSHLSCKVPNEMPPLPTRLLLPSATENHPFSWTPEHCWSDLLHTWSTWAGERLWLALDVPIYTDVFPLSNQTVSSWVKGSSFSSILPSTHPPRMHLCIYSFWIPHSNNIDYLAWGGPQYHLVSELTSLRRAWLCIRETSRGSWSQKKAFETWLYCLIIIRPWTNALIDLLPGFLA